MRNLLLAIGLLLALVAVVTGCRGEVRYDARLTAADSLMAAAPDSALALVEALDSASLATPGDRAYRNLLVTQARYKCYITATSDSDINRALAYYRAHSDEQEKLTRAYIYKGAVMEELGHPDSAMLYYKHAEATAASDDYFNLGYTNLRIAQLYQSYYSNDSAVVARMKKAYFFFMSTGDTSEYLITTIGTQGVYNNIIGKDSARIYLERAINIAKIVNSPKRLQYQSKLAGSYFYDGNYNQSKEIAMDILRNECDDYIEDQFYYYAVRSYIHLNCLDSAIWLMSLIPEPLSAEDSMNYFQTMAELSLATHKHNDYEYFAEKATRIDIQLLEGARSSKLTEAELSWDANNHEKEIKRVARRHIVLIVCLAIFALALFSYIVNVIIKRIHARYKSELDKNTKQLEKMLGDFDEIKQNFEHEQEQLKNKLEEKDTLLIEIGKSKRELEQKHEDISKQVSTIVRYKHAALNELYQSIRIKTDSGKGKKSSVPLIGLIREMYKEKGILHTPPKDSFWNYVKLAVDGEYQGIASFMERRYPNLTKKNLRLFCLLCAGFPNPIIKLCMNYSHDVTVSKNKKKLMKEKIGMDIKLDDFIELYLQGKLY